MSVVFNTAPVLFLLLCTLRYLITFSQGQGLLWMGKQIGDCTSFENCRASALWVRFPLHPFMDVCVIGARRLLLFVWKGFFNVGIEFDH